MVVGHDHVQSGLVGAIQWVKVSREHTVLFGSEGDGRERRADEDDAFAAWQGGCLEQRDESCCGHCGAEEVGVVDGLVLFAERSWGVGDASVVDELR